MSAFNEIGLLAILAIYRMIFGTFSFTSATANFALYDEILLMFRFSIRHILSSGLAFVSLTAAVSISFLFIVYSKKH